MHRFGLSNDASVSSTSSCGPATLPRSIKGEGNAEAGSGGEPHYVNFGYPTGLLGRTGAYMTASSGKWNKEADGDSR